MSNKDALPAEEVLAAPSEAELAEKGWTEDVCRFCGAHIGYGVPDLHVAVCDKPGCTAKAKRAGRRRTKRYTKGRR